MSEVRLQTRFEKKKQPQNIMSGYLLTKVTYLYSEKISFK